MYNMETERTILDKDIHSCIDEIENIQNYDLTSKSNKKKIKNEESKMRSRKSSIDSKFNSKNNWDISSDQGNKTSSEKGKSKVGVKIYKSEIIQATDKKKKMDIVIHQANSIPDISGEKLSIGDIQSDMSNSEDYMEDEDRIDFDSISSHGMPQQRGTMTPKSVKLANKQSKKSCCCCLKGIIESKKNENRKKVPNNRFANLPPDEKSRAIREIFRRAIRKALVKEAFLNARHLFRFQTVRKYTANTTKPTEYRCLVMPGTNCNIIWTIVVLLLLLYTATVTPFAVVFVDDPPLAFLIWEGFIDCLFMIDICINFFTPYYSHGLLVTDKTKIAKKYLKTWFLVDFIACIPFNWILGGENSRYNKLLRLMRVARIYRLLRLFRLFKIAKMHQMSSILDSKFVLTLKLNPSMGGMIQAIFTLIFFVHLFGCFWFQLAKFTYFEPDCWVVRYGLQDKSIWDQYVAAIYWVLQTITTVGYGDIYGITTWERLFGVITMMFGVGFYSFTIGNVTALVTQVDYHQRKLRRQLSTLVEFAKKANLPKDLVRKIKFSLEHRHGSIIGSREQELFLEELPSTLKAEVLTHTHKAMYQQVPFFRGKNPLFLWELLPRMQSYIAKRGDILYWEGDIAEEMFFLINGGVDMINSEGYMYKTFNDGSYLGHTELFDKITRMSTAKVCENSTTFLTVKRKDFMELIERYPSIKAEMIATSEKRKKAKNKLITQAMRYGFRLHKEQRERIFQKKHINMFNVRYSRFQKLSEEQIDYYPRIEEQKRNNLVPPSLNPLIGPKSLMEDQDLDQISIGGERKRISLKQSPNGSPKPSPKGVSSRKLKISTSEGTSMKSPMEIFKAKLFNHSENIIKGEEGVHKDWEFRENIDGHMDIQPKRKGLTDLYEEFGYL